MARDKSIDRRLVCNWDKADNMFYCIVQKWNGNTYENQSYFETEQAEINGPTMTSIHKDR